MNRVPIALRNRVTVLFDVNSARKVFVLGTAHLSRRSPLDVHALIRAVRPSDVFVELCENRAEILYRDGEDSMVRNYGLKDFTILPELASTPGPR